MSTMTDSERISALTERVRALENDRQYQATKADLSEGLRDLEVSLIKWIVSTALVVAGLAVGATVLILKLIG